jgi:hypothetical protein
VGNGGGSYGTAAASSRGKKILPAVRSGGGTGTPSASTRGRKTPVAVRGGGSTGTGATSSRGLRMVTAASVRGGGSTATVSSRDGRDFSSVVDPVGKLPSKGNKKKKKFLSVMRHRLLFNIVGFWGGGGRLVTLLGFYN